MLSCRLPATLVLYALYSYINCVTLSGQTPYESTRDQAVRSEKIKRFDKTLNNLCIFFSSLKSSLTHTQAHINL